MGIEDGGLRSAPSRKESFVSLALDLSPASPLLPSTQRAETHRTLAKIP